jgi:hypothetical protein
VFVFVLWTQVSVDVSQLARVAVYVHMLPSESRLMATIFPNLLSPKRTDSIQGLCIALKLWFARHCYNNRPRLGVMR